LATDEFSFSEKQAAGFKELIVDCLAAGAVSDDNVERALILSRKADLDPWCGISEKDGPVSS
jgi:hypothetical protein